MKIIKPSVEILTPVDDAEVLKHIERCGRICYKSEDKITDTSADAFVANIIKRGHEAVLEHGSFRFQMNHTAMIDLQCLVQEMENKGFFSYLRFTREERSIVSGNVRAWRDFMKACVRHFDCIPGYMRKFIRANPVLFPEFQDPKILGGNRSEMFAPVAISDLKTITEHLVHHDVTAKFICDRGVSHEIVRHRPSSYCQESTRYCNYSKDGFGGEITVIAPLFLGRDTPGWNIWRRSCETSETAYFDLLDYGCTPQEARSVLPNSLKTEIVTTAALGEWHHFMVLRTSPAAHPQMREVAILGLKDFRDLNPSIFSDINPEV